ncbi:TonB-dependent receptor [Flavobacterium sp. ZT3R18]|uniref:TonB-dependent receptor plug domain-containing protein n=1 Tax=Flavobacterium sp. ZT3R18 TaxID=2594429 RepID=UPI00117BA351|nr:TonB-dependent receptor [Flavobacterium sp. ZT3R18]TRX36564.1 TonB-dependent receptor [Flavobacterium sp. ZT3R18]
MSLNKMKFIGLILLPTLGFAQVDENDTSLKTEQLNDVVVTATRTERQLSTLPLPTYVITATAIERAGVTRLNEILAQQTGLITTADFGGVEGIQMQGLDAAYTLILMDGVPLVGRSAGTLDLSRVSVGNIERIEIVKGASSSLYGSEALAGVINIITKKPKTDLLSGSFSYRYATFNTMDTNASLNWKKKKFSGAVFADYFKSDGYDLDKTTALKTVEPYQNITIQPRFYFDFSQGVKLTLGTRYYHQKQDYKTVIQELNYNGDATINEWDINTKVEQKWNSKISTDYELYTTNYKNESFLNNPNNVLFEENFYDQWLFRPEIRTTFSINKNKLTTGIGLNYETLNRTYFAEKAIFNSQFAFLQYDYNPTDKWNILAGLRYDNNNQYQSQLSPKLAINFKLNTHLSLKSSIGYGFKAPDFRQLYFDFTNSSVGYTVLGYNVAESRLNVLESQGQLLSRIPEISFENPLKPESSINFNFGSFYKKEKLKIEANLFYNSISNLIDTRVVAQKTNGQNVFSYFNIDQIFTYGLELNAAYNFSDQFNVSLGYQYLIAKDQSVVRAIENGTVFARNPTTLESFQIKKADYFGLLNRSKNTANVKLYYTIPKLKTDFNLQVFYRSKYGLSDSNSNQILDKYDDFVDGYATANFSISKQIKEKLFIQMGVNNLFDFTNPEEISTVSGRQIFGRLQFNY